MDKKKRSANVTEEQKTLLLQYMEKNPRFLSDKFSVDFTYKDATILWQKIADILNSCNGISKDWKSWRKCWQDLRSRSKMKQSKINAERNKTGGGTESNLKLSTTEAATLNLICSTSINGHTEINESEVHIGSDSEIHFEIIGNEGEYLQQNVGELIQIGEHNNAVNINMESTEANNNEDKENSLIDNSAYNLNENDNNGSPTTLIIKKREKKLDNVQSIQQPTEILAEVAKQTYQIQSSYYDQKLILKKRKLRLQKRLVNAVEKCNPS
ncbi:PREDICTED: uncharacterized protein LOC108757385 [Trachymyrmex cornetzi]|uniref:uncharacterized protein LOC108757385 n=1 Tax=Trachymyrmex cornetzi TaxID=471704 RepID=UPI00084F5DA7|nr:PREDICTED: uncharacterized protein LOC108757385 [Trachymyrmex cornetzi]